jgi:trypsin
VTQQFVLTAAHCLEAFPSVASTAILVGDHDLRSGSETIWSAAYLAEKYIKHRDFNSDTNANDIALIKVSGYIRFK